MQRYYKKYYRKNNRRAGVESVAKYHANPEV